MVKKVIITALIGFSMVGCATWQSKTPAQKQQAAIAYYRIFSAGLSDATLFMSPEKAKTAQAVIAVADRRVDALEVMAQTEASAEAIEVQKGKVQGAMDAANAAVAVEKPPVVVAPGASNSFFLRFLGDDGLERWPYVPDRTSVWGQFEFPDGTLNRTIFRW